MSAVFFCIRLLFANIPLVRSSTLLCSTVVSFHGYIIFQCKALPQVLIYLLLVDTELFWLGDSVFCDSGAHLSVHLHLYPPVGCIH